MCVAGSLGNFPSTKYFTITSHGNDNEECFRDGAGVSCKTIGFILDKECTSENVLIVVQVEYEANFVHREPCFSTKSNGFLVNNRYQCSLTLAGSSNVQKSDISFNCNSGKDGLSIFYNFVEFDESRIETNTTRSCNKPAKTILHFENLIIHSLQLSGQYSISADNIEFLDFHIAADGAFEKQCLFFCHACVFSATKENNNTNVVSFSKCKSVHFTLTNCSFFFVSFQLSFTQSCWASLQNITFEQDISFRHSQSSVTFQQIETDHEAVKKSNSTIPTTHIHIRNISVDRKFQHDSDSDSTSEYTFSFYFLHLLNQKSIVIFENCLSRNNAKFLNYVIAKASAASSPSSNKPPCGIQLNRVELTGSYSSEPSIRIQNFIGGFVSFSKCSFTGNIAFESPTAGTSFILLNVSNFLVHLEHMSISGNTGVAGGALHIAMQAPHSVSSTTVNTNQNSNIFGELIILLWPGDANVLHSTMSKIHIENCTFANNKATKYGGALHVESIPLLGSEAVPEVEILVSRCDFLNNSADIAGGALMLRRAILSLHFLQSRFIGNTAMFEGSAMYIFVSGYTSKMVMEHCVVAHHYRYESFSGGVLCFRGDIWEEFLLKNVLFYDNNGGSDAVVLVEIPRDFKSFAFVMVNVTNCTVKNNVGRQGFLLLSVDVVPQAFISVHLANCLFEDNHGYQYSGVIFLENRCLDIFGCHGFNILSISNCTFLSNSGDEAGVIYVFTKGRVLQISVSSCYFEGNVGAQTGGTMFISHRHSDVQSTSYIHVSESVFFRNVASVAGSVMYIVFESTLNQTGLQISLEHDEFFNNAILEEEKSAGKSGGAFFFMAKQTPSKASVNITHCNWHNNTSSNDGGALALYFYESSSIVIEKSSFIANNAQRFGGACFLYIFQLSSRCGNECEIQVIDSNFINNSAGEGGALLEMSLYPIESKLVVKNTSFLCCSTMGTVEQTLAVMIRSLMSTHLQNTEFICFSCKAKFLVSVLILETQGQHRLDNVHFSCHSTDVGLSMNSFVMSSFIVGRPLKNVTSAGLQSMIVTCVKCASKPFPAGNGEISMNSQREHFKTGKYLQMFGLAIHMTSPCQPCPFGGDCSRGAVKALPNYWGYTDGSSLHFVSCPIHYCCTNIDTPCVAFDTCALHRTGQLCGECETGFSQSLMSAECVSDSQCNDWWIWPLGCCLALAYLLWYMYKSNMFSAVRYFLVSLFLCVKGKRHKVLDPAKENRTETSQLIDDEVEHAYFDILVYFANVIRLIKVHVEFQSSDEQAGFFYDLDSYFMKYLDVDVQQAVSIKICAFPGMGATGKALARPVFIVMVVLSWCLLTSVTSFILLCCRHRSLQKGTSSVLTVLRKFQFKLTEGFVVVAKYSYSGLAGTTFKFLTCVSIGQRDFWKYNGEMECWSMIQKVMMMFAAFYVLPFVLISPLGGKLLKSGTIGHTQFMLACIFPLPFVVFWLIKFLLIQTYFGGSTHLSPQENVQHGGDKLEVNKNISQEAQVLLHTYQGVYKDKYAHWEGVIEIRKLVFCTFYLENNNIKRLVFCTLAAVISLVHHIWNCPFKHMNSNRAESLSLALLCVACVTNGIKSVFPDLGLIAESNTPTEELLYFMNRLDRILIIFLLVYILTTEIYNGIQKLAEKKQN